MLKKRTISARMLWTALIMLSVFVSFLATPATLTHASQHDNTVTLQMHHPVYTDDTTHAASALVVIDRPVGIMALCASPQPGETTTLDVPNGGLQLGETIDVSWYTDSECGHTSNSSEVPPFQSQSYTVDHSPYVINLP